MHTIMHTKLTRRALLGAAGLAGVTGLTHFTPLHAQESRPIRLILPVGVGSGVDTIVRSAGAALNQAFDATVVIENMPGAGGIVGTSALVRAPADGFTFGVVSNNHVIFPSTYASVPFDPIADITPISVIGTTPMLLIVNPARFPQDNVQDLLAVLRANPQAYNYASSGSGTILHLAMEMFLQQAQLNIQHVPYKGVGPMLTDIMSGQVDLGMTSLPSILSHLQSGTLKALGVGGAQRIAAIPHMPTIAEQGLPDYQVEGWFALVGPAGLSAPDVAHAHQAFAQAYADAQVQKAMAVQGNTITLLEPAQTRAHFRSELEKYARVVKAARLTPL